MGRTRCRLTFSEGAFSDIWRHRYRKRHARYAVPGAYVVWAGVHNHGGLSTLLESSRKFHTGNNGSVEITSEAGTGSMRASAERTVEVYMLPELQAR